MPAPTTLVRRIRTLPVSVMSLLAALGVIAVVSAGAAAVASRPGSHDVAAPPAVPKRAGQIQNIDQVKTAIKGYYDDTVTSTPDPVDGKTMLHEPAATGNYAHQVRGIEQRATRYLDHKAAGKASASRKPAILLDVDDTSLVTYDYEIYSNFVYNPATNAAFVNNASFPAVFGMSGLVRRAAKDGYTIFFLTGRPEAQRAGTAMNLTRVGYPSVPAGHLYLKDLTKPIYRSCAPTCTTTQYKSLTRRSIEQQGYKIYANFGDQFSDLAGGYAARTYKLPNPMYYLP